VAVSGYTKSEVVVELFPAHAWSRQPDFPESKNFWYYSTATVADTLYIFGGYNGSGQLQSVTVGRMRNSILEWTAGPDLLLPRYDHRSIAIGNNILHIGGNGEMMTEKWIVDGDRIEKELLDLTLYYYEYYPELFAVNENYCNL